jgi:hypothetical protein
MGGALALITPQLTITARTDAVANPKLIQPICMHNSCRGEENVTAIRSPLLQ